MPHQTPSPMLASDKEGSVRRHPTVSLVVMLAIGLGWCWLLTYNQGETPGEPADRGMVAGSVFHFIVIGGVLVVLWAKRVHWEVMVAAPLLSQVITLLAIVVFFPSTPSADSSDDSTVFDGFIDGLPYTVISAALLVGIYYWFYHYYYGRPRRGARLLPRS